MNIAFVISSLNSGGAERVCTLLSNYFSEQNHHVTIFTKNNSGNVHYRINKDIQVKEILYKRNTQKKWNTLFKSATGYGISLYKTLKQDRSDIIISFGTTVNGITILIAKLLNRPIIVSDRTAFAVTHSFFQTFTRKRLYKFANAVVSLTFSDKINYYDKYTKNTLVIPNPTTITCPKSTDRKNVILCIGHFDKWYVKGLDRMFDIYAQIQKIHPDWELWIAGGGNTQILDEQYSHIKSLPGVKFLGLIKNLSEIYSEASIFALSSRNEGMPNALLEAMACGCACISFDIATGPAEIIDNNTDGILIKDNDLDSFANETVKLIENKDLRLKMGKNAVQKSKQFNIDHIGNQWIELIHSITKKNKYV